MCSKVSLICVVLLAISFVHSLPSLSESGGDQLAPFMTMIQGLNTTSPKGDEKGESEFGDLLFTVFFDDDDSDEDTETDVQTDPDFAFGPEFNVAQFLVRLDDDMEKAHNRRCKKISGKDDTYKKVKAATKQLGICLKNWSKSEGIRTGFSSAENVDDYKSFINKICVKRDVPIKCLETHMTVDNQCSFPSEIEDNNSLYRFVKNTLNLICANDGNDFISLIFEQGRQCLMENVNELKTCSNRATYAIVKGFLVKLIEYETFEFKMDAEDCKDFDAINSCYVSAVENCVDPITKNFFASILQIARNETECAKIRPLQSNLLH